jgi:PEP-CTERM motif
MKYIKTLFKTLLLIAVLTAPMAFATVQTVTIDGSDAIFLAGRTDLTIPAASAPWNGPGDYTIRHGGPTPEEIQETLPPIFSVASGDVIRALDPAVGGISFFNGVGAPFYGPSGNGASGSSLTALGGISGYIGPQGALTGVFITDAIPLTGAPATMNFTPSGSGIEFSVLNPGLGQVFYIGDGKTTGGDFQTFIAPTGATRLALGIPDGFGFNGAPGAYDDNDGSYSIRLGINEIPTPVPEPTVLSMLLAGLVTVGLFSRRRRQ